MPNRSAPLTVVKSHGRLPQPALVLQYPEAGPPLVSVRLRAAQGLRLHCRGGGALDVGPPRGSSS